MSQSQTSLSSWSVEPLNESINESVKSHTNEKVVKFALEEDRDDDRESEVFNVKGNENNNNNIANQSTNPDIRFSDIPLNDNNITANKEGVDEVDAQPSTSEAPGGTFKLRLASKLRTKRLQAVAVCIDSILLNSKEYSVYYNTVHHQVL
jgi:hypothetical protein